MGRIVDQLGSDTPQRFLAAAESIDRWMKHPRTLRETEHVDAVIAETQKTKRAFLARGSVLGGRVALLLIRDFEKSHGFEENSALICALEAAESLDEYFASCSAAKVFLSDDLQERIWGIGDEPKLLEFWKAIIPHPPNEADNSNDQKKILERLLSLPAHAVAGLLFCIRAFKSVPRSVEAMETDFNANAFSHHDAITQLNEIQSLVTKQSVLMKALQNRREKIVGGFRGVCSTMVGLDLTPSFHYWRNLAWNAATETRRPDQIGNLTGAENDWASIPMLLPEFGDYFIRRSLGLPLADDVTPFPSEWKTVMNVWLEKPHRLGNFPGEYADLFREIGKFARRGNVHHERLELIRLLESDSDDRALRRIGRFLAMVVKETRSNPDVFNELNSEVMDLLNEDLIGVARHLVAWAEAERGNPAPLQTAAQMREREKQAEEWRLFELEIAATEEAENERQAREACEHQEMLKAYARMATRSAPTLASPLPDTPSPSDDSFSLFYVENFGSSHPRWKTYNTTRDGLEEVIETIDTEQKVQSTEPAASIANAINHYLFETPSEHKLCWPKEKVSDLYWSKVKRRKMRIYIHETAGGAYLHIKQRKDWLKACNLENRY